MNTFITLNNLKKRANTTFLFLVFAISGFYISSCGPDEERDCQVVCDSLNSAPQDLLDYFVFNNGSYWVYRLKGTDSIDTLSFAGINSEFFELKAGCNYGITPCEMRYSMGFDHSNLDLFPPGNIKNNSSDEGYFISYLASSDQWGVSHLAGNTAVSDLGYFLSYPFTSNQQYSETTFLAETATDISVPLGTFNCIETKSQVADTEAVIMSMHWAKGIGLVRYQIAADKIWELVAYNLK